MNNTMHINQKGGLAEYDQEKRNYVKKQKTFKRVQRNSTNNGATPVTSSDSRKRHLSDVEKIVFIVRGKTMQIYYLNWCLMEKIVFIVCLFIPYLSIFKLIEGLIFYIYVTFYWLSIEGFSGSIRMRYFIFFLSKRHFRVTFFPNSSPDNVIY